jgi:hypothetical protein
MNKWLAAGLVDGILHASVAARFGAQSHKHVITSASASPSSLLRPFRTALVQRFFRLVLRGDEHARKRRIRISRQSSLWRLTRRSLRAASRQPTTTRTAPHNCSQEGLLLLSLLSHRLKSRHHDVFSDSWICVAGAFPRRGQVRRHVLPQGCRRRGYLLFHHARCPHAGGCRQDACAVGSRQGRLTTTTNQRRYEDQLKRRTITSW